MGDEVGQRLVALVNLLLIVLGNSLEMVFCQGQYYCISYQ